MSTTQAQLDYGRTVHKIVDALKYNTRFIQHGDQSYGDMRDLCCRYPLFGPT